MPAPGIAGEDTFKRQPAAAQRAMLLQSLYGILRTGGGITALGSEKWRQELLVKPDDKDEDLSDHEYKNRQSGVSACTGFSRPVFGRRGNNTLQPRAYFSDHLFGIGKGKLVVAGIDKKAVQLCGSRYLSVELMFLQAPGLLQQPAYPVALYGLA